MGKREQWVHMRGFTPRTGSWILAALCVGLAATRASAQEQDDAAETAAARAIALDGIRLADGGRCDEAIDKLSRAEKLHHAPVVLGRLGECQVLVGKLVDGTETLRKVLREPLPPNPSTVLSKARERAQSVLDKAKGRIGALNIIVKGPHDNAGLNVLVDGQAINLALLEMDRPTDPGDHLVEANAAGFLRASAHVSLGIGDKQSVVMKLEPDPNAHTASNPSVAAALEPRDGGSRTAISTVVSVSEDPTALSAPLASNATHDVDRTAAYVAWTAGGAGLVVGTVLALIAFNGKGDLDNECVDNVCPSTSQDRLDSARLASTAATVSVALGGVGIGLGTIFYFSAGSTEDSSAAAARTHPANWTYSAPSWQARGWIGVGGVGLDGTF